MNKYTTNISKEFCYENLAASESKLPKCQALAESNPNLPTAKQR